MKILKTPEKKTDAGLYLAISDGDINYYVDKEVIEEGYAVLTGPNIKSLFTTQEEKVKYVSLKKNKYQVLAWVYALSVAKEEISNTCDVVECLDKVVTDDETMPLPESETLGGGFDALSQQLEQIGTPVTEVNGFVQESPEPEVESGPEPAEELMSEPAEESTSEPAFNSGVATAPIDDLSQSDFKVPESVAASNSAQDLEDDNIFEPVAPEEITEPESSGLDFPEEPESTHVSFGNVSVAETNILQTLGFKDLGTVPKQVRELVSKAVELGVGFTLETDHSSQKYVITINSWEE